MEPSRPARGTPASTSRVSMTSQEGSPSNRYSDRIEQAAQPLPVSSNDFVSWGETPFSLHGSEDALAYGSSASQPGYEARPTIIHSDSSFYNYPAKAHVNDGMNDRQETKAKGRARNRDILFAAATIFLPILAVSLLLLGFTFFKAVRVTFPSDAGNDDLPASNPSGGYYYTTVKSAPFALVGSWASSIAVGVFTPFMLLFSFLVAWAATSDATREPSHMMRGLLRGNQDDGLWRWILYVLKSIFCCVRIPKAERRALHMAGVGFLSAFIMSLLVISADNWLHLTTETSTIRIYYPTSYPLANTTGDVIEDSSNAASYALTDFCSMTSPTDLFVPCSLNHTGDSVGVMDPEDTYLVLNTGISRVTDNFNNLDFTSLEDGADARSSSLDLVVHYKDNSTNATHAFLFWAGAAEADFGIGDIQDYGIDYVAQTTSVSTTCSFVTNSCDFERENSSTSKDTPIYNCFDFFQGNLNQAPSQGIETTAGWNTSFYELADNATRQETSINATLNPFNFFIAAALESTSFGDLPYDDPDSTNYTANRDIIDAGSGHIAFVLDCRASVYDVNYTLINGTITKFVTRLSNETTAAIVKAPLQASFGTFNLFERASIAVLSTDTLLDQMAQALSEVTIAGAFGAFIYAPNVAERIRYDQSFTRISKPALLYFVITSLLYAALGLSLMIAAFVLRAKKGVRERQADLLPQLKDRAIPLRGRVARAGRKDAARSADGRRDDGDDDDNRRDSIASRDGAGCFG